MKFYFYLIFCLTSFGVYAQVDLTNGLVGCYPFSGNANDMSVSANHGTVSGAKLANDRFGKANSAYEFDGLNDYIEISPKDLELNEFSYSLWVYPRTLPRYTQALFLFSIGSDYGDQHVLFGDHYSNERHTGLSHGSYLGVANNILCSAQSVEPINKWYHLVLVKDDKNYYLYVNNKVVCTNSVNGGKAFYGTSIVRGMIGARNNYGQFSNAIIDDIHLYNRAINVNEVDALYNGVTSKPVTGSITSDQSQVCAGENVILKAETSSPGATFKWTVEGVAYPDAKSDELIFASPASNIDYSVNVKVEISFDQCFPQSPLLLEKTYKVNECSQPPAESKHLFVPDVFTPNSDGKNDTWEIFNPNAVKKLEVSIYSRWGEVIHHSKEYTTPWNGMYQGKLVQPGVYTYKILSSGTLVKSGVLNVLY